MLRASSPGDISYGRQSRFGGFAQPSRRAALYVSRLGGGVHEGLQHGHSPIWRRCNVGLYSLIWHRQVVGQAAGLVLRALFETRHHRARLCCLVSHPRLRQRSRDLEHLRALHVENDIEEPAARDALHAQFEMLVRQGEADVRHRRRHRVASGQVLVYFDRSAFSSSSGRVS